MEYSSSRMVSSEVILTMPVSEVANALTDYGNIVVGDPLSRGCYRVTSSTRDPGGTDLGSKACEAPLGGSYKMVNSIHVRVDLRDPGSIEESFEWALLLFAWVG